MSIADVETVDSAGIDEKTGEVVLTIDDGLDWQDERTHFEALERKVNAYVAFIKSGRLLETMPLANGRKVRIAVYHRFEPPFNAVGVLESLGRFLLLREVGFSYGASEAAKGAPGT